MLGHINTLTEVHLTMPSIVTIGVYDGVHVGHQYLVDRLVREARATNRMAVAVAFFPHPDILIKGVTGRYYLTTPEERAELLLARGIDLVVSQPFTEEVRHIRAASFVDNLIAHLRMTALWVGVDFALGYKREGDVAYLTALGQNRGFTVEAVGLESSAQGRVISSTRLREILATGDVALAATLLGRPYSVAGEVVHGDHRGRTIGFPTANLKTWDQQLLPANGVYAGWAYLDDRRYMALTNVGIQPTFDGGQLKLEAHLLDFEGDIYGRRVRLAFVERLRPEKRFSGIDDLVAQIDADVARGRQLLGELIRQG